MAAQVAAAVAYLHTLPASAGGPLIHRDIKPANMFLDGRLNAKLGDVGLASLAAGSGTSSSRRKAGEQDMVGTYPYLAPEYRSSGTISLKTDVYALGVSLLQLATGQQERLQGIVQRCGEAAAAGAVSRLLDPAAGSWDEAAGERFLCLGLWCCCASADGRPSSSVVAHELAKLHEAADLARKAATNWWAHSSSAGSRTGRLADTTAGIGGQQQPCLVAPGDLLSASSAPTGGSFWRFLTGTG